MFTGYTFNGVYGWGDATNPNLKCSYASGATPPSSGPTYTALVAETGGVRAQICSDSSAWTTFFNDLATGVVAASKIACNMQLPTPASGTLDPTKVNVSLTFGGAATTIGKALDASHCDAGGWYYDSDTAPTQVILCPSTCDDAQTKVGAAKSGKFQILFGCDTQPIVVVQ